jgi:diguanylate cyclase (GGDEF)-like protein
MPNFTLKLPLGSDLLPRLHSAARVPDEQHERALRMGLVVVGVGLCTIFAISLRGNLVVADGIAYLCASLGLGACAGACVAFARRERGMSRARWALFATACAGQGLTFLGASLGNLGWLHNTVERIVGVSCASISATMLMLSATVFFTRNSRPILVLDWLQALLFCSLRFALIYAPDGDNLFRKNHLIVSTASSAFFFLTSLLALLGVRTELEKQFLRLLSVFLGLQTICSFLMSQVAYTWMHQPNASVLDLTEIASLVGFAYVLVRAYYRPQLDAQLKQRSRFLRNLMPSFLALGNLAMGLIVLPLNTVAGVVAIVLAVICIALRASLQQGSVGLEQDRLYEANQQLQQMLTLDPLTGAGNRRSLATALMNLARRRDLEVFSLMLVDADWFKQANDCHGHLYGDQVLVAIAKVLRTAAEGIEHGHCARLGGDEFALLLPNCNSEAAYQVAEEVRMRVKELALKAGDRMISISVGATVSAPSDKHTFESLMSRADEALYTAKSLGRNRVEIVA